MAINHYFKIVSNRIFSFYFYMDIIIYMKIDEKRLIGYRLKSLGKAKDYLRKDLQKGLKQAQII